MDFHRTIVASASWDKDEMTRFCDQRVKGQGHSKTKVAAAGGIQSSMLYVEF